MPGAGEGVAVFAESAPVVRWGPSLPTPDREGVASVGVEARIYILAWLGSEGPFVPDDLEALDLLPVLLEIDALDEEEAAFHPLEGYPSVCASGYLPRADQFIQALEVRIRLWWLLSVSVVVCHNDSSSLRYLLMLSSYLVLIGRPPSRSKETLRPEAYRCGWHRPSG